VDPNPDSPKSGLESGLMDIPKIMSPHKHITVKVRHWDSMRSASAIGCLFHHKPFINSCKRHINIHIAIVWFIWASMAQQQRTFFRHGGRWPIGTSPKLGYQNRVFDWEHRQN
jgi:hypothetical protein